MLYDDENFDKNFNFIRVEHNGETVSIVQHMLKSNRLIQEVAILPEMDTIVSYDGTLESLIETLQTIKNHILENAQC
jgi:hypothetical protein